MRDVRCAVIGAGWWGTAAHVPALARHPRARLVAVQHHDGATANRIAHDFGAPRACTSHEEVLDIEGLEAVVISSPPHLHYPQAKAALQGGLHVLVEKPMTITRAEAQELVDLAARNERELLIGCTWHYTRHSQAAQKLVRSGQLGEIRMMSVLMTDDLLGFYQGHSWDEIAARSADPEVSADASVPPGSGSYSDPAMAGGGQIYAQASHPAAFVSFLTGDEPASVHAQFDNAGTAVDVYNVVNVRYRSGMIVSLASTGASGGFRAMQVQVYGTQGILALELFEGTMKFWDKGNHLQTYPDLKEEERYPRYAPAENLVEVALGEAPNQSPGLLGLSAMKFIEAACESARSNQSVVID